MSESSPRVARTPASTPFDEAAQTREHEAFMRSLAPAAAAAAQWHTRREDGLSAEEEAQFQQWLAADPAHAGAYGRLDQSMQALRALPAEKVAHLHRPAAASCGAAAAGPARRRPPGPQLGRRLASLVPRPAMLAACSIVLLAGGLAWHQWHQPTYAHPYATQRGQRLNAPLPDGSELVLDAATRTRVALYRDRREVHLEEGQVMVSAAPDTGRPFHVLAGAARITVVGTRFSVRYASAGDPAGGVEVAVEEGRVMVQSARTADAATATAPAATLEAGQRVQVDATGAVGEVGSVPPHSVALWRRGLIRFSDTPLSQVIREMERYGPTHLVVQDETVAALRIGGSYELARPGDLAQLLPRMLPVRLVPREGGKLEVVRAR